MRRIESLLLLLLMAAFAMTGCSQQGGVTSPAGPDGTSPMASSPLFGYALPDGATLTSATLNLFIVDATYMNVDVFRATRDWDEATTTWNSFNLHDGGAYDPTVLGSFATQPGGVYASVDVTAQVQAWMDGVDENLGFVLLQRPEFSSRTEYYSRERGENIPFLELTYTVNGQPVTETIDPLADTQINEESPDTAFGLFDKLYTGWRNQLEKETLIRFDLDVLPPGDGGDDCGDHNGDCDGHDGDCDGHHGGHDGDCDGHDGGHDGDCDGHDGGWWGWGQGGHHSGGNHGGGNDCGGNGGHDGGGNHGGGWGGNGGHGGGGHGGGHGGC